MESIEEHEAVAKAQSKKGSKSGSRASQMNASQSQAKGSKDIGSKSDDRTAVSKDEWNDPDDPAVGMDIDCASTISMQTDGRR